MIFEAYNTNSSIWIFITSKHIFIKRKSFFKQHSLRQKKKQTLRHKRKSVFKTVKNNKGAPPRELHFFIRYGNYLFSKHILL